MSGQCRVRELDLEHLRDRQQRLQARVGGVARTRLTLLELLVGVPAELSLIRDPLLAVAALDAMPLDVAADVPRVRLPCHGGALAVGHLPRLAIRPPLHGLIGMAFFDERHVERLRTRVSRL